jgi:DNA-binding NtrC family response regulator
VAKILVIEDEDNLRFTIKRALTKAEYAVTDVASLRDARAALAQSDFDLILTDVFLGHHDNGLDFVKELRAEAIGFDGTIVVMTAFSSVENAVAAMRLGADDYIQKPLSLEELGLQVAKWLHHRKTAQRLRLYERLERTRAQDEEPLGASPAWKQCLSLGERLAGIPLPPALDTGKAVAQAASASRSLPCILITGETGAGKGVLARHIHARALAQARASGCKEDAPFVHVNCSSLPAASVESELFGVEKSPLPATETREARPGLFEMADGGTIFLDEVAETPLELQAKLLSVLEHGTFRRVGGTRERRVRVRVIAASNQNLEHRAASGAFRRDLLYRLNAFTIRIPALRERADDVLLLADDLLGKTARRFNKPRRPLSDAARSALSAHDWPGNVRELVNAVQRAVMLSDGPLIEPADLGLSESPADDGAPIDPDAPAPGAGSLTFDFKRGVHTASGVEKELIMQALRHTRGNVSRAAKLINMQRSSLRYRIDRYKLDQYVLEVASR